MNSRTIRYLIILTTLTCVGIIAVQVYGLTSAYRLEEQTFNLNVNAALRTTAEKIWKDEGAQTPPYNPVEKVSKNFFMVQVNVPVDKEILLHYLKSSLSSHNINTDFAYCISDCTRPD